MSLTGGGVLTAVLCPTLAALHLVSCNYGLYTCGSALLPLGVGYMFLTPCFMRLLTCTCQAGIKQDTPSF